VSPSYAVTVVDEPPLAETIAALPIHARVSF
jgi:hypothetical protein